jgi:hypothetical protein
VNLSNKRSIYAFNIQFFCKTFLILYISVNSSPVNSSPVTEDLSKQQNGKRQHDSLQEVNLSNKRSMYAFNIQILCKNFLILYFSVNSSPVTENLSEQPNRKRQVNFNLISPDGK